MQWPQRTDAYLLAPPGLLSLLASLKNSAMFITGFSSFLYNPNGAVIYNTLMLSVIFFGGRLLHCLYLSLVFFSLFGLVELSGIQITEMVIII